MLRLMLLRALLRSVTFVLAGVTVVSSTAVASAKPGVFGGSLGVAVPKGAQADIRAVDRATGSVVATRSVGRDGRFALSLAPGTYLIVGTVVSAGHKVVETRIGVSLKSGQKRKRASLKARKRRRARAAFVQERGNVTPGRIAVEIPDVTGSTGDRDWDTFKLGINDVMMNDVAVASERGNCATTLLEVDRRADLIKELEFQQSPYVDPSTRHTRNFIIGDIELRGSIARASGGNAKVTMTIVDKRTGKPLSARETTLEQGRWPDQLESFSNALAGDLCKLSDVFMVTLDVSGAGRFATHSGTGAIHVALRARRDEPGRQVWRATGPLQWDNATFATNIGQCPLIDPVVPAISWSVTITDAGAGQLQVTWTHDGNDATSASVDCFPDGPDEPDPPPIPGQPGVALLVAAPQSFLVPYAGGTQAVSSGFTAGGDGFFNTGSITITPAGIG